MRRALRWIGRAVAVLTVLAAVAIGVGVLYLRSERGGAFLRERIQTAVAAGGARLATSRVTVSSLRNVALDDVELSFGRRSTLRARRVRITWTPLALVWGQVRIGMLSFDGPRVRLVRRGGSWGFPDGGDSSGPGPRIRIERLRIDDGRLAIGLEDGAAPTRIVLRDVRGEGGVTIGWLRRFVDVRELYVRPAGRPIPALAVRGGVTVRTSELRVDAQLATDASTVALSAVIGDDGALRIEGETPRLAAADVRRFVPTWKATDDVAVTVEAVGPRDALDTTASMNVGARLALRGAGTVDATVWPPRATLDLAGSTFDAPTVGLVRAESLRIAAGGDAPTIAVEGSVTVADGRVDLDGRLEPGRAGGVGVRSAFSLPDLTPWTRVGGAARGTVELDGAALRVELAEATVGAVSGAGSVTADVAGRTARVDLGVRATATPARAGTIVADVAMPGDRWRAAVAVAGGDPALGTLRATARVEPAASGITARLDAFEVAQPAGAPWRLGEPTTLRWEGGLAVDGLVLARGTSRLRATGRVRPAGDDALDLTVTADPVNLADVRDQMPAGVTDVEGRLEATIRVRGPLAAPVVDGDGTLVAPRLAVPGMGTLTDLRLRVRGSSLDVLRLESLEARAGAGEITGAGEIGFLGGADAPVRAELRLRRVPLARRPLYEGVVGGRVAVDGTVGAPRVTAELRVPRAVLQPRLLPQEGGHLGSDPTITIVGDPEAPRPPPSAAEALAPIEIHATVTIGKNVRIVRKDADIRLAGVLAVDKAVAGPFVLTGPIELAEGWYEFRRRRFDVRSGTIRFTGRPQPDPELEVRARHRARGYTIWVTVGGTASSPTLALSSEPSLSEADVLAVLLFGRPADQLQGEQQGVVGREAQVMALSYVAPALEESVRDVLPIDRLEVSGEGVTVARNVTQDIFISLSQELTDRGGQTVGMEYDITPRTSLKLSTSSRGSSAIDFFWRRRY